MITLPVSYTSVSRVGSAFPMLNSVSNITSGVIHQYAGDVQAEIDALIGKRYTLPLTVECPILTAIATRETIYRLAVQRGLVQFPPAAQGRAPLAVQHEGDQKLLEKIAKGDIGLVDASGAAIGANLQQIEIYSTTQGYLPTMHEGPWTEMVQDPDKITDLENDRAI